VRLLVNSLGEPDDRARYVDALRHHFERSVITAEARATLAKNPLRVLDSKREADAAAIATAPRIADFYSAAAGTHFAAVLDGLQALGIEATVEPRLVRGLDYYRHTTFEFQGLTLDSAQNALGGGGRYDGLVESLGGPATHGIGFALGLDRTLLACDDEGVFAAPSTAVDVFVVDTTGGREALLLCTELRAAGVSCDRGYEDRSMKSQMKLADRSGAELALIVGTDELDAGTVTVRPLRSREAGQRAVVRTDVVHHVLTLLSHHPARKAPA
jgi:histidyl-tRNA synthetase